MTSMNQQFMGKTFKSKQDYLKIFKQFDMDNSGGVSKQQIIKVLKACQIDIDIAEAQDIINEIDADGGGQVQQDQFIAFLQKQDASDDYSEQQMRKIFTFFLQQGQNKISSQGIKRMFLNLGQNVIQSDILAMMSFADKDQDGYLNFQQFNSIIRSV